MIVVADTSALINLCRVGHGNLFHRLFQTVTIPPEVAAEFARLATNHPRFAGLLLPEGIRQQSPTTVPALVQSAVGLDAGEAAALSLAVEIHADAILVDERRGFQVARQLGLRAFGVIGILLRAKSAGLLPAIQPVLDALVREAGFWIDEPLRQRVLQLAGEAP